VSTRRADARRPPGVLALLAGLLAAALVLGCAEPDPVGAAPGPRPVERPAPTILPPEPLEDLQPPPPPASRAALMAESAALVDAALGAATGDWGVLVTDEYGREVVAHLPDTPLLPASTLKVVTAASALETFGPSGRLYTFAEATAPMVGGTLAGDLLLVGGGDPALATDEYARWIYPARPVTRLSALADDLVEAGLRRIEGDVVGIAPGFAGPAVADGWLDRYFSDFDARNASGLTVDAGLQTLLEYADDVPAPFGLADGVTAGPSPSTSGGALEPDGTDSTGPDGIEAPPSSWADVPFDQRPDPIDAKVIHAPDPAAHAASELARLLIERGVVIGGRARSGPARGPAVERLAGVHSAPIIDLLRFALETSDNHLTDGLFLAIGAARTGEGSWTQGDAALRMTLDVLGVEHAGARFADGSGLSREDRATARMLVDLDRAMADGPFAEDWWSTMAVMGETGTLRRRLVGSPAHGRFVGKTGSLRDVMSISGTVIGDDGRRYHLAVIANDALGDARWAARVLMDELILLLSADVADCAVEVAESIEDRPFPRGALEVRC
jgi:serine-type D-Ala-D-Ala carboxypeptidase/endopeptidase (penicillin-binding protein 4)